MAFKSSVRAGVLVYRCRKWGVAISICASGLKLRTHLSVAPKKCEALWLDVGGGRKMERTRSGSEALDSDKRFAFCSADPLQAQVLMFLSAPYSSRLDLSACINKPLPRSFSSFKPLIADPFGKDTMPVLSALCWHVCSRCSTDVIPGSSLTLPSLKLLHLIKMRTRTIFRISECE